MAENRGDYILWSRNIYSTIEVSERSNLSRCNFVESLK